MKKLPRAIALAIFAIVILTGCSDRNTKYDDATSAPQADPAHWTYDSSINQNTDKMDYNAQVFATQRVFIQHPQLMDAMAGLMVSRANDELVIGFIVGKGSLTPDTTGGYNSIKAIFDNDSAQSYMVYRPSNGSERILFINSGHKFLTRLKTSKKLTLEVAFENNGLQKITFNTGGLVWNH